MEDQPKTNELKLVTSRKDRKQFINFPYRHYSDDTYWVAPLKMEQKKLLDTRKNPFYKDAEIGLFLVYRNGEVCGRIAAIEDRRYNQYHETKTGFFGFFECIDDETVAKMLVQAASGWVKDRGLTSILGPTNPSLMDEIGILVDGFDHYPSFLMPYNKRYYDGLLKSQGFEKEVDLYAFRVSQDTVAIDRMRRAGEIVKKRNPELEIREVNLKNIHREVQIVRDIFIRSWSDNWGFIPLTEEELAGLADDLKLILNPKFAHIVEADGKPIAFSIGLPDLNQALRHMNGRLFPFGIFKLLWYQRKMDRIRTALMGVIPEYRGKGIDALLHLQSIENGLEHGFHSSELSWVLESNKNMIRTAERIGAHIEKTYRMYRKDF